MWAQTADDFRSRLMNDQRKTPIQSLTVLSWEPAPHDLRLQTDEVHLWCAQLGEPAAHLQQILSAEERARAQRFRFARDRDQFVIARGMLRTILAQYLNVAPAALQFGAEKNGKPYLLTASGTCSPLQFNVSHTSGLALFAMAWHCALGVDVEQVRAELADEMTAQQFLSPSELHTFRQLPPPLQPTAFFNSWTCKEAYLKALGVGLSVAPDTIAVTLDADAMPRWLAVPAGAAPWSLCQFVPQPGYVGALAVEGAKAEVRFYSF